MLPNGQIHIGVYTFACLIGLSAVAGAVFHHRIMHGLEREERRLKAEETKLKRRATNASTNKRRVRPVGR
jgi:hypothetical protein